MNTEHDDEPLPDVSPADALAIDNRVQQLASSASILEQRSISLKPIVSLQARQGPVPARPSAMRRKLVGRRTNRLAPLEMRMMLAAYDDSYKQRMLNEMTERMQSPIRAVRDSRSRRPIHPKKATADRSRASFLSVGVPSQFSHISSRLPFSVSRCAWIASHPSYCRCVVYLCTRAARKQWRLHRNPRAVRT